MKQTFLVCLVLIAGCGGGSDGSTTDAGSGSGSGHQPALACKDLAYCSTYEISQYNGTVHTPAGGTIVDGVYRLAYMVNPDSAGQSNATFGAYAEVYRFAAGTYVDSGIWGRGTFTTSGTTLTMKEVANCNLGSEGDASSGDPRDYSYTAAADRITFFDHVTSSNGSWTAERVFLKVDDVCQTVTSAPTSPGDSYRCTVQNCACKSSTNGTVQACD